MSYVPVSLNYPSDKWQDAQIAAITKHRLYLTLQKLPKGGGTHFSLTAPGPIVYFGFDKDVGEDVLPKFKDKKQIVVSNFVEDKLTAVPLYMDKAEKADLKEKNKPMAQGIIDRFEHDLQHWLGQPIRTVVIDTETELYELKRFAEFGAASANKEEYATINLWFKNVLSWIEKTDVNLILLQQRDPVWINNSRTGDYEGKGFKRTHYQVKANVKIERSTIRNASGVLPFELEVIDSSQNPLINGLKLQSDPSAPAAWDALTGIDVADRAMTQADKCNFPWLAVSVFPDTKLKDWV